MRFAGSWCRRSSGGGARPVTRGKSRVRLYEAASSERLFGSPRGVLRGLLLGLAVDLGHQHDGVAGEPEPQQEPQPDDAASAP